MSFSIPPVQNTEIKLPVPELSSAPTQAITGEQLEHKLDTSTTETKIKMLKDIAFLFQSSNIFPQWVELLNSTDIATDWTPEQINEAWNIFIGWTPSEDKSLIENLGQLQQLYLALKSVMDQGFGSAHSTLSLENVLNQALMRLIASHLGELETFLKTNGQQEATTVFKGNLFQAVANTTIPHHTAAVKGSFKTISTDTDSLHKSASPIASNRKEGYIYRPNGNKSISVSQPYSYQTEWETLQTKFTKTQIQEKGLMEQLKGISNTSYELDHQNTPISSHSFSVKDLEKTSKFVKYLNVNGCKPFAAKEEIPSEEAMGFRMAIIELKTQVFADYSGVSSNIGEVVKRAVHQLIYQYLSKANDILSSYKPNIHETNSFAPLDRQQAFSVYNEILKCYDTTKKPEETIQKGLTYTQKEFLEKRSEKEGLHLFRYEKADKFFSQLFDGDRQLLVQNLKEAVQEIKKDWNEFIKNLELKGSSSLFLEKEFSKMGAFSMLFSRLCTPSQNFNFGSGLMVVYWLVVMVITAVLCFLLTLFQGIGWQVILLIAAVILIMAAFVFRKLT